MTRKLVLLPAVGIATLAVVQPVLGSSETARAARPVPAVAAGELRAGGGRAARIVSVRAASPTARYVLRARATGDAAGSRVDVYRASDHALMFTGRLAGFRTLDLGAFGSRTTERFQLVLTAPGRASLAFRIVRAA